MKIQFVTIPEDSIASYRYRVMLPASVLWKRHAIIVKDEVDPDAEVVIFMKHWDKKAVEKADMCRASGQRVIFDICDWHFDSDNPVRQHYIDMIGLADAVTVSTDELAQEIEALTDKPVHVVLDPYEMPEAPARFQPHGEAMRILWFGHPTNMDTLQKNWGALGGCYVQIISIPVKASFPIVPWSQKNVMQGLNSCDAVFIPALPEKRKLVKGANRAIEAIRRGRFVVASDIPSYRRLASWMWVNDDLKAGIDWLRAQRSGDIEERIRHAQDYVRVMFDPERIAKQWEQALTRGPLTPFGESMARLARITSIAAATTGY